MYDYHELSLLLPELKDYIKDNKLDYSCPRAVRLLNSALLLKEFDLKVDLPDGHLCPTVINRRTFIERIEFLMKHLNGITPDTTVTGIDIGTGVSCVYPLIACKRNPNWNFLASDIDDQIINYARKNVEANYLQDRIKIIKNPDPNAIFPQDLIYSFSTKNPSFLICNPPFYTDVEDLESRSTFKRHKANNMVMTKDELGTELGGEVGFIKAMISESLNGIENRAGRLCESINLFSCMLGLKDSLTQLIDHLNTMCLVSFAFEPLQIKHTTRYLLFWSFTHQIPNDPTSHRLKFTAKTTRQQVIPVDNVDFDLKQYIGDLNSKYGESSDTELLVLKYNKWSRKARRSPTPIALPSSIQITIEYQSKIGLIFTVDEDADWEIFLGFINHLRKEEMK